MKMNTGLWIAIAALAAGAGFYFAKKKKEERTVDISTINKETINGCLNYDDVISWFKNFQLKKGEDTPFIAQSFENLFDQHVKGQETLVKDGYVTILLGTYSKTNNGISNAKILFAKDLDPKLKDLLGKEKIVTLS